jgi:hypothetical protein
MSYRVSRSLCTCGQNSALVLWSFYILRSSLQAQSLLELSPLFHEKEEVLNEQSVCVSISSLNQLAFVMKSDIRVDVMSSLPHPSFIIDTKMATLRAFSFVRCNYCWCGFRPQQKKSALRNCLFRSSTNVATGTDAFRCPKTMFLGVYQ